MKTKCRELGTMLSALSAAVLVLSFPESAAEGMSEGISICLSRVIPSIFPMMLVCMLIVECGLAQKVSPMLAPLSRKLFGLPGEAGAALLLALIGGYPAGAKGVMELYHRGAVTKQQAGRMSLFCFSAGPAFLVGVVGGLAGNSGVGWLLLAVQALTVIIIGITVCRINPVPPEVRKADDNARSVCSFSDAVVTSVSKSASAMLQVCLYIMIFAAVGSLLTAAGVTGFAEKILLSAGLNERLSQAAMPILLEVTGGCVSSAGAGLPVMAFAVGFGGLSVQMQVLSVTEKLKVNRGVFFAVRCLHGAVGAALTALAVELLPDRVMTVSAPLTEPQLSGSPQGAVMLVIMCAMCVLCLPSGSSVRMPRRP